MTMHRLLACAMVGVFALGLIEGCAKSDEDDDEATASTTAALQAQSQAGITDGVIDSEGSVAPSPEDVAERIVTSKTRGLLPEGCVKKTREGSVVTLKLDGCTGPFGKVVIVGTIVATFSKPSTDVLHVDIEAGEGTSADGRPVTYSAQADARFDGDKRFLSYRGGSSGTTRRGQPFTRNTELTIAADVATHCAKIDGISKGSVGKYDVDLTIEGLEGCRNACPTAGLARATVDGPLVKNASVEVRFDGSDKARVKIDAKKKRDLVVQMDCDAAEAAE